MAEPYGDYKVPDEYLDLVESREDPRDLLDRVQGMWDLSGDLPYPFWKWVKCPACASPFVLLRRWKFHAYRPETKKTYPYRADVGFKCRMCSMVWTHGVVVPEEMFLKRGSKLWVYAREALDGRIWLRETEDHPAVRGAREMVDEHYAHDRETEDKRWLP